MLRSNRALVLHVIALLTTPALAACGSADAATGGGGTGNAGTTTTTTTDSIASLTSCVDDDIMDGFTGPGYDASMGGLLPPLQATYVVGTTVLLQSSDPAKEKLFNQLFPPVLQAAEKAPGFVGFQLGLSAKCHYARTLTVWKDMDSMMTFVASPAHASAADQAADVSEAGAVTNWEITAAEMPPTWAMARSEIEKMGQLAY